MTSCTRIGSRRFFEPPEEQVVEAVHHEDSLQDHHFDPPIEMETESDYVPMTTRLSETLHAMETDPTSVMHDQAADHDGVKVI